MAQIIRADSPDAVGLLSACLAADGIAIAPCDTIYGILGRAPVTESRIREIKGRGENKPFIVLQPSVKSVLAFATQEIENSLLDLWPGALTLIIATGEGNVGMRVPADSFLVDVLNRTGPLYSTSVNVSGEQPLWRIADIKQTFSGRVDMIVDGGDMPGKLPSTIVDITKKPYRVLRYGVVELPADVLRRCT